MPPPSGSVGIRQGGEGSFRGRRGLSPRRTGGSEIGAKRVQVAMFHEAKLPGTTPAAGSSARGGAKEGAGREGSLLAGREGRRSEFPEGVIEGVWPPPSGSVGMLKDAKRSACSRRPPMFHAARSSAEGGANEGASTDWRVKERVLY